MNYLGIEIKPILLGSSRHNINVEGNYSRSQIKRFKSEDVAREEYLLATLV